MSTQNAGLSIPENPVVFAQSVESLYKRGLDGKVSPTLEQKLRGVGIDLAKPLLPAYPFPTWNNALLVTAQEAFGSLSRDRAFYEMGRLIVTRYQETLIGGALFVMLRVLPARKIVDRMARNFRTTNNFTEIRLAVVDDNTVDVSFNLVEDEPAFTQGILAAGLPAAGVKGSTVSLIARHPPGATFRLSWS